MIANINDSWSPGLSRNKSPDHHDHPHGGAFVPTRPAGGLRARIPPAPPFPLAPFAAASPTRERAPSCHPSSNPLRFLRWFLSALPPSTVQKPPQFHIFHLIPLGRPAPASSAPLGFAGVRGSAVFPVSVHLIRLKPPVIPQKPLKKFLRFTCWPRRPRLLRPIRPAPPSCLRCLRPPALPPFPPLLKPALGGSVGRAQAAVH